MRRILLAITIFHLQILFLLANVSQLPDILDGKYGSGSSETMHQDFLRLEYEKFLEQRQQKIRAGNNTNTNPTANSDEITSHVAFRLYTKASPKNATLLEPNMASIAASPFDARKDTRFMTHGFWSSGDSDTSQNIKNAYLAYQDVNVILVDWKQPAATLNYISAAMNTVPIGRYTAELLDALVAYGADPKRVHLVGHSLGAHISGFAGKYAKHKVSRITGLDPAGPLFETLPLINDHLSVGKADFVDIIHTSAGALGYKSAIGDIDFFPNNGEAPQPGCKDLAYFLGAPLAPMLDSCSHGRSWMFFADSINPAEIYKAEKCQNYQTYSRGACNNKTQELMGEYVQRKNNGTFYLRTNSQSPFPAE